MHKNYFKYTLKSFFPLDSLVFKNHIYSFVRYFNPKPTLLTDEKKHSLFCICPIGKYYFWL